MTTVATLIRMYKSGTNAMIHCIYNDISKEITGQNIHDFMFRENDDIIREYISFNGNDEELEICLFCHAYVMVPEGDDWKCGNDGCMKNLA